MRCFALIDISSFRDTLIKSLSALTLLAIAWLLASCGSGNNNARQVPPPNIDGSWELIAVPTASTGAATGIEVQLTEGQILDNGIYVPNGQIAADSSQIAFVDLETVNNNINIDTSNSSGFGGSCSASATTNNSLSGNVTGLGQAITFSFTANGNVFNASGTLSGDGQSIVNGTYMPQGTTTCDTQGGTITGTIVSLPTGQFQGTMCSPSLNCSNPDGVTATVSAKSGTVTVTLLFSSGPDDGTSLTLTGPAQGNSFSVQGTYQGSSVTYYGYSEQVYVSNTTTNGNVQSVYVVDAADPCFSTPGTSCSSGSLLQVPQIP
ncbi:MAG TPA: hypothetical protein VMX38_10795 [Verrucomicrobiae bacterium]|jgi:hypothetical protein|nr:hypothetical protein [Verrucomicrobiae bacterium]